MYDAIEMGPVVCIHKKFISFDLLSQNDEGEERTLITSAIVFANGVDHSFLTMSEANRRCVDRMCCRQHCLAMC